MKKPGSAPRVGELLPHIRRHPQRDALVREPREALRQRMAAGDMVAGLLLALSDAQLTLLRARLRN